MVYSNGFDQFVGEFSKPALAKAREVIKLLLDTKAYAALCTHALSTEAFEPAMKSLMPKFNALAKNEVDAMRCELSKKYVGARLAHVNREIDTILSQSKQHSYNIRQLEAEQRRLKDTPSQALGLSEDAYMQNPELLDVNFANLQVDVARMQCVSQISSEITVLEKKIADLALKNSEWSVVKLQCAQSIDQNYSSLFCLSLEEQTRYQAELEREQLRLQEQHQVGRIGMGQQFYAYFIHALDEVLNAAEAFEEKPQLLQMVEHLKSYLQARHEEQEAGAELNQVQCTYLVSERDLETKRASLKQNQEVVLRYLNAKQYNEQHLPSHVERLSTARAKKRLYWGLAALAVGALIFPIPLVFILNLSLDALLLAVAVAFVSFIAMVCFLAVGARNRDSEVQAQQQVDGFHHAIRQNAENISCMERKGQQLQHNDIPNAEDAVEAVCLKLSTQREILEARQAQTQASYQAACSFRLFPADGGDGVADIPIANEVARL